MTPMELNSNKRYEGVTAPGSQLPVTIPQNGYRPAFDMPSPGVVIPQLHSQAQPYPVPAPPLPSTGDSYADAGGRYSNPALGQAAFGGPPLAQRPELTPIQRQSQQSSNQFNADMSLYESAEQARRLLAARNDQQLAGRMQSTTPYEGSTLTPQQQAYVGATGPQMPLTNTRFVEGMAETPRDLSGTGGVSYDGSRPFAQGGGRAYIPQYQTDGSVGQSRFVEGTTREVGPPGSGRHMTVSRNPDTGGIKLSGGGVKLTEEQKQAQYQKRVAYDQAQKDSRVLRAARQNDLGMDVPAVAIAAGRERMRVQNDLDKAAGRMPSAVPTMAQTTQTPLGSPGQAVPPMPNPNLPARTTVNPTPAEKRAMDDAVTGKMPPLPPELPRSGNVLPDSKARELYRRRYGRYPTAAELDVFHRENNSTSPGYDAPFPGM